MNAFTGGRGKRPFHIRKESSFPEDLPPEEKASLTKLQEHPQRMIASPKTPRDLTAIRRRQERKRYMKSKKQKVDYWIRKLGISPDAVVQVWGGLYEGQVRSRARGLWKYKRTVITATFKKLQQEMEAGRC